MLAQWAAAGVKTVVTPCADCRHVFTRLYPGLEGGAAHARGAAHRRAHRPAGQGRAARAHHARAADGHLPRPLQPRPPGRALRALGGRREEDLRPGGGLRPAAAAPQRRARASTSRRATCSPRSPASSSSRWSAPARPPGAAAPAAPAARPSPPTRRRPPPSAWRRLPSTGAEALVTACSRCELNFNEAVAAMAAPARTSRSTTCSSSSPSPPALGRRPHEPELRPAHHAGRDGGAVGPALRRRLPRARGHRRRGERLA